MVSTTVMNVSDYRTRSIFHQEQRYNLILNAIFYLPMNANFRLRHNLNAVFEILMLTIHSYKTLYCLNPDT